MNPVWDVPVGGQLTRAERMKRFGGGKYGGIEPSAKTPNVFIYSDPSKGTAFGYNNDGWNRDRSIFYYTGEGKIGPQVMADGNLALFNHRTDGRALRVFVADGVVAGSNEKQHRYIGEFELDHVEERESVDETGELRTVFVFALRPIDGALRRDEDVTSSSEPSTETHVELVDLENTTKNNFTKKTTQAGIAERREAQLVDRYATYLGRRLKRWKIVPKGTNNALFSDHYDVEEHELYEAKGNGTRTNIRLAIGQLLDYRHHIEPNNPGLKITVLLPSRPGDDIIELLRELGINCVHELPNGGFQREPNQANETT